MVEDFYYFSGKSVEIFKKWFAHGNLIYLQQKELMLFSWALVPVMGYIMFLMHLFIEDSQVLSISSFYIAWAYLVVSVFYCT